LVVPIAYVIEVLKSPQFRAYEKMHGHGEDRQEETRTEGEAVQPEDPGDKE